MVWTVLALWAPHPVERAQPDWGSVMVKAKDRAPLDVVKE